MHAAGPKTELSQCDRPNLIPMKSKEEMLTPAALKLMRAKLRTMGVDEFTKDARMIRILSQYRKESGGSLLDLMERKLRTGLPAGVPLLKDVFRRNSKSSFDISTTI